MAVPESLQKFATATGNYIAQGADGWVRSSHITWITTAALYGVTRAGKHFQKVQNAEPADAAKLVFLLCSISTIAHTFLKEADEKANTPLSKLPSKHVIIFTNAAAVAVGTAHYFQLKLDVWPIIGLLAASYTLCNYVIPHFWKEKGEKI